MVMGFTVSQIGCCMMRYKRTLIKNFILRRNENPVPAMAVANLVTLVCLCTSALASPQSPITCHDMKSHHCLDQCTISSGYTVA